MTFKFSTARELQTLRKISRTRNAGKLRNSLNTVKHAARAGFFETLGTHDFDAESLDELLDFHQYKFLKSQC